MSLETFLNKNIEDQQSEISDVITNINLNAISDASADEALGLLESQLKTNYQIEQLSLQQLTKCKSQLSSLTMLEGSDAHAYNRVQFVIALTALLDEQIQKIQIEQCRLLCKKYMTSLNKEMRLKWNEEVRVATFSNELNEPIAEVNPVHLPEASKDNSSFLDLTRNKYAIVKKALAKLDSKLPNDEKLAAFKKVLKDNEDTLAAVRINKKKEASKQLKSLFLINIYRILFGTEGTRLLNKVEPKSMKEHMVDLKKRLLSQKKKNTSIEIVDENTLNEKSKGPKY